MCSDIEKTDRVLDDDSDLGDAMTDYCKHGKPLTANQNVYCAECTIEMLRAENSELTNAVVAEALLTKKLKKVLAAAEKAWKQWDYNRSLWDASLDDLMADLKKAIEEAKCS